jgi:low affinity Fe/Cu permease
MSVLHRMKKSDRAKDRLPKHGLFQRFARTSARETGHPLAFGLALGLIAAWVATGPVFHFSDTWQLVINTATTIVTFLMVFLIQNTQNRDSEAVQLKLDELIRANEATHNALLNIEELSEHELDQIKSEYERLAQAARKSLRSGKSDLGLTEVNASSFSGSEQKHNDNSLRRAALKHK